MQDKHHDIDKLFQDAFQNHEAAPPFDIWNKIEGNLPLTETDLMFKKAFENYEKEPSSKVWERIKPELPLSLTLRNGLIYLSRIAAVLLIGITLYVFGQQFDWRTNNSTEFAEQQESFLEGQNEIAQEEVFYENDEFVANDVIDEPLAMLEEDEVNNTFPLESIEVLEITSNSPLNNEGNTSKGGGNISNKIIPSKVYTEAAILNIEVIAKRVKAGNKERIPSNELYSIGLEEEEESSRTDTIKKEDKAKILKNMRMEDAFAMASNVDFDGKIRRPYKSNEDKEIASTESLPYLSLQGTADASFQTKGVRIKRSALEQQAFDFTGLYFNINAAYGTSSVLNNSLKEAIAGGEGQYNALTGGSNLGIGIGYQFKPNWSVETGVNYVNQSQSYKSFADTDIKANLNYASIPLTLKYRSNEISGKKPSAISYVFGVQAGFLNEPQLAAIIAPISVQDLVIEKEIAITAGVDYDLFLNPNLSWTIGARATAGTGLEHSFDNFNTFIGIRSAFNFRVGK